jgi:hypothetical protein
MLGSFMVGPTKTDNGNSGYLIVVDVTVVAPPTAADVRLTFENFMLYEDEERGDTHMAVYITRLTQRMVNPSWHSPLTARTPCLNMLGGDMMSPVGRAEKAVEAESSAPLDRKASAPMVMMCRTVPARGEQSICVTNPITVVQDALWSAGQGD